MAGKNSIYCPSCERHTALTWVGNTRYDKEGGNVYHIGECNNCNCVFLVRRKRGHGDAVSGIVEVYPGALPKSIGEGVPDFLREDLKEAYQCFAVGAYRATSVMARRALQSCCIDKGAKDSKNLQEQVDNLFEMHIITKDLKELAHTVRLIGNDSAHPPKDLTNDESISEEDANEILELLDGFVEVLYVVPYRTKKVQENRNDRN